MQPLIYIASLRRTGSTLLSEALTKPPHCFIFVEPALGENDFGLHESDAATLSAIGIDLTKRRRSIGAASWLRRRFRVDSEYAVRAFHHSVVPILSTRLQRIGVKEIRHGGWRHYHRYFPDMRVVLTSRDPRDIFLSLHDRVRKRKGSWRGPLTPERVAADLNGEFEHQLAMHAELECHKVRYEDLCLDPDSFEEVKRFTGVQMPGLGRVGEFLSHDAGRVDEHELHGGRVSDRRVNRWMREEDLELKTAAERTLALMPAYCEFWGYGDRG